MYYAAGIMGFWFIRINTLLWGGCVAGVFDFDSVGSADSRADLLDSFVIFDTNVDNSKSIASWLTLPPGLAQQT